MSRSEQLFQRAQFYMPGGVNSPVRAFKSVGGTPVFMQSAMGAYLTDVDGKQYIDYVGSWGPAIVGHAHDDVIKAVTETAIAGLSFGTSTEIEVHMAEKICDLIPSIEMVRMTNSGTEATMSAIRLARGYSGRDKLIKFHGCYHGAHDAMLVSAGSGALTHGVPNSPGVPDGVANETLLAHFNDLSSVKYLFEQYPEDIAAIIVEPIAGNMNCVPATHEFLQGLRDLCDEYDTVLIFDEVMTGFRVALGGAQEIYQITPDLTTLGKIIGGGMPVGAFGGKRSIMEHLSPLGPVYQAGTLSGNPVAMAAGLSTLDLLMGADVYQQLSETSQALADGIASRAADFNIPVTTNVAGGMFGLFFTDKPVHNFDDVKACSIERFKLFFHGMLRQGIYLPPSAYEACFVSTAHQQEEIDLTLRAAEHVFAEISEKV